MLGTRRTLPTLPLRLEPMNLQVLLAIPPDRLRMRSVFRMESQKERSECSKRAVSSLLIALCSKEGQSNTLCTRNQKPLGWRPSLLAWRTCYYSNKKQFLTVFGLFSARAAPKAGRYGWDQLNPRSAADYNSAA